MSTYYTVACHTCKKKLDLRGYADSTVIVKIGEFARYGHISHDITVLHDITGWDEEYDKAYDKVMSYENTED